jgi:hypothetical protein
VAHWFLLHPGEAATHGRLAAGTGIDKGQLSRVLARLAGDRDDAIERDWRVDIGDLRALLAR